MSEAAFDRLIDTPELKGDTMRLALLLIVTAERSTMIIKLTRADMAKRLGIAPTNVSRLMTKLTAVGLVVQDGAVRKVNPTWAFGADSKAHGEAVAAHYLNGGVGVGDERGDVVRSVTKSPRPPRTKGHKAPSRGLHVAPTTPVQGAAQGAQTTVKGRRKAKAPATVDVDQVIPGQTTIHDAGA